MTTIDDIFVTRSPRDVSDLDVRVLRAQLGRSPRGLVEISARCVCGNPLVVRTLPRLPATATSPAGEPFPTSFYLSHPLAASAIGRLEGAGVMDEYSALLAENNALREHYAAAHEDYIRRREELGKVPEIAAISAGGMPTRVKCLHALIAHSLATGPGVNPIGDLALVRVSADWRPDRCQCKAEWRA